MVRRVLLSMILLAGTTANAAPLLWTLNNVVLTDGQTLTGSFVYDANLGQFQYPYSNISITNSGASYLPTDTWDTLFVYGNGNPMGGPTFLYLMNAPANQTNQAMILRWDSSLTNAGGVVTVGTASRLIFRCGNVVEKARVY